jgi:uncharacterized protein (TIGR03435 family)
VPFELVDFGLSKSQEVDSANLGEKPARFASWWLGQVLQRDGRPVIDKTGLDRNYDFTLAFAPELPPDFPKKTYRPDSWIVPRSSTH